MRCLWVVAFLGSVACGAVRPQFDLDTQAALARDPMRKLTTQHLEIYYPKTRKAEALRVANHLEICTQKLKRHVQIRNAYADQKMVVVMPEAPFNNAYVQGPLGRAPVSVVPTYNTADFSSQVGTPPSPQYIGCHEIVHYVHLLQVDGLWRWVNGVFGDILSPQYALEPWFAEGLATYYESALQPGVGRLSWPAWRGWFHAGIAGKSLRGGDLSFANRDFGGMHYLIGSFFVDYLVRTYGEMRLWQLIREQGNALAFFFAPSYRFDQVYGKSLATLLGDFSRELAVTHPVKKRPRDQTTIRRIGRSARYARAPNGVEAMIQADNDSPTRLVIYRKDGSRWRSVSLTEIVPPRKLMVSHPSIVSGLSFTGDGKQLYFTTIDRSITWSTVRLIRYRLDRDVVEVVRSGLGGSGGGVSPSGGHYYFSLADGDRHHLAELDLNTNRMRVVRRATPGMYFSVPNVSPDGQHLVTSVFVPNKGYQLWVLRIDTGKQVQVIAQPGTMYYDPKYVDSRHIVFVAGRDGPFQVSLYKLDRGIEKKVSDAPYLAMYPSIVGTSLRFLNRDRWHYTLDEVQLAPFQAQAVLRDGAELVEKPVEAVVTKPLGAPLSVSPDPNAATKDPRGAVVVSDRDYSQWDHLLIPQVRAFSSIAVTGGDSIVGLALLGSDRLSFHNWFLAGWIQPETRLLSGQVGYVNTQLAPLVIGASASVLRWEQSFETAPDRFRRESSARLSLSRLFRQSLFSQISALVVEDHRHDDPVVERQERRLAGASISLGYTGSEATAYAGVRRGLGVEIEATYYPRFTSTFEESFADLQGQLNLVMPLPFSKRHTLNIGLRGRGFVGLASGSALLQVGGTSRFATLYDHSDKPEVDDFDALALPTQLEFVEFLRGFEEFPLALDRVAILNLVYRYPLILDEGFASTFWLLPSLFFRQLDFELFANVATDTFKNIADDAHAAVGGSLTLKVIFGVAPLELRYQLARRLSDDEALVHMIAIGAGF